MTVSITKLSITATIGIIGSFFGWSGWLLLILIFCATADWLTGSTVGWKKGKWSSKVAREGIFRKIGMFLAVLTAGVFDVLVHLITINLPILELPFDYHTLLLPILCIWYICTELGSLIENAGHLGAPIPTFLTKAIELLKDKTEE
jgi:toxin secretion/phage lysis holin